MRKMVVRCSVGYAGMNALYPLMVEDDATQAEIDEQAWQIALDHAEMYGYYPFPDDFDEFDDGDEACDQYSSGIEGFAEDYVPEKHDGHYAGDLAAEFERM